MSHSGGKTGVGLLSLKWNNYKSIFFETIKTLREKSKYTDATLAVDGHFYHVHKLVMSTCSEYFSDIFEKTPCKAPIIVLKDVSKDEIEGLLSYMYLGEVNVHHNNLASFLKTAESLRIKGLAVSDDEPTNLSKSQNSSRDSPSLKKRRLENTASSPAVPPVKSLKKSDTPLAMKVEMSSPEISTTKQNKPPMVEIGMGEADDRERRIRTKINYEEDPEGPGSDQDSGDIYEPNSPMTEHEALEHDVPDHDAPDNCGENNASTSFFGSAQQQSGEVQWEEGNASNIIPETYIGNVSTSLQKHGESKPIGDNEAIIHQLKENLRKASPVTNMKYEAFRSFCQAMMKVINGGKKIIGYGKPQKTPTWWPSEVPWAKTGFHVLDYADIRLVAHSAYHHYGIPFQDIQVGIGDDANEIQYGDGFETLIVSDDDNQSLGNGQTQSGFETEIQPDDPDSIVAHGRD